MNALTIILSILATAGAGSTIVAVKKVLDLRKKVSIREELSEEEAIARASAKAKEIILDAKNEALNTKTESEETASKLTRRFEEMEKRAVDRELSLTKRAEVINQREDKLESREKSLEQAKKSVKQLRDTLSGKLEEVAALTREQAQKRLLEEVEADLQETISKRIHETEKTIQEKGEDLAKKILIDAMQKSAVEYVSEATVTTVPIPSEDMKGRIIGRVGRNIKAFEKATGVDVIVDDSPDAITLSCFDPLRREIAAITMQKLVADGRIHPGRIEEIVEKVKRDLAKEVKKTGEDLAYQAGAVGLPDEIIHLLGRFKFRYSYGQNLIKHTLETMKIGSALASEIGANVDLVKRACLLHDLGKVLTHEVEGAHHHVSGQLLRKYKMDEKLINAVESHHGDIEPESVEAIIVYIADAISGARPGARVENYDEYIKRIKALEDSAMTIGKEKVKEVFAIHAGREVRVIVNPDVTDDNDAKLLAHKISRHIEKTQTYPGTVTVNVIREFREQEIAK